MVLSKKDALLMRSIVFSSLLNGGNDNVERSLQELLDKLDEFLLSDISSTQAKEEEDSFDDDDEEVEEMEVDELLPVEKFVNLPLVEVENGGVKVSLEFEEAEDSVDSVSAIFGDYEDTYEVVALELTDGKVRLHRSDGEVIECRYEKPSKRWSKTFEMGKLYGVGEVEEDEEDE